MIEKIKAGKPLDDIFIFDCHGHIGSGNEKYYSAPYAADIVSTQKALGINATCVSSFMAFRSDYSKGHDEVISAIQAFPDRIYGYACLSPYYPIEPELERCFKCGGFLGIKIIMAYFEPRFTLAIDDERMTSGFEYADRHNLPVLIHTWSPHEVVQSVNLAKKYRNANFIIAHSAWTGYAAKCETIDAVKKYDNVFVDTAISTTYEGSVEWLVDKIGCEKILFGTDMQSFDCRQTFGRIALSKIKEEEKIKIFGQNAKKIFEIK